MNYKQILDFHSKAVAMGKNIDNPEEYFENIEEIGDYMNEKGEEGMKIVLNRLSEEDFVKFVRVVKTTLLASMITEGNGSFLLMAEMTDELDTFTHTMILGVIGALAEEEVI